MVGLKRTTSIEVDEFAERQQEINAERIRLFRQLGETFFEANKDSDMSDTIYKDCFKSIKQNFEEERKNEALRLAKEGIMKCSNCGAELSLDSLFCNKCGTKQEKIVLPQSSVPVRTCPKCGNNKDEEDIFCIKCGYKFQAK